MWTMHPVRAAAAGAACLCVTLSESPNGVVSAASEMGVARASHTSTLLPDGRVLIAGGFPGSAGETIAFATTELYDPTTGRFSAGRPMRVARSGHSATALPNGKVLIVGGWTGRYQATTAAELYDPATGTFSDAGTMAVPRADQTATLLADGRVLIVGGADPQMNALASAELYDPRTERFTPTASLARPRFAHTATRLADGRVLVVGGGMGRYPSQTMQGEAELFDPATGRFTPAGSLGTPRHKHAAALLADGSVLIVGGSDNRDWRGRLASAERWVPSRSTFVAAGSPHDARFKLPGAVTTLADGRVLVAGGAAAVELYDRATDRFQPAAGSLGAARFFSAATRLRDGSVLVTGGYAESGGGLPATRQAFVYRP